MVNSGKSYGEETSHVGNPFEGYFKSCRDDVYVRFPIDKYLILELFAIFKGQYLTIYDI